MNKQRIYTFTAPEAQNLLDMFGGAAGSMTVANVEAMRRMVADLVDAAGAPSLFPDKAALVSTSAPEYVALVIAQRMEMRL
jgi:hypothetical protein